MLWPDLINGCFEACGGLLLWMNVYRLYKDKEFKGVSTVPTAFFMGWGYWNLYYYPAVNCPLSFCGGLVIVAANTVWLGQMVYYSRRNK
jgi:hypothetical protein